MILQKERKWDWKQEACPGFHAVYTAVLILEDYREVTGRLAVPEKLYVYVVPFETRSPLKSWKTSFGNVFRTIPRHGTVMTLDIRP